MKQLEETLTIAVDFDGTIVEHEFPQIGKEKIFAIDTLLKLQEDGHRLILWTYRHGKYLEEAVMYCQKRGLEFYAVNASYPEEDFDPNEASRKLNADLFIDDRNIGGLYGWGEIYQMIANKSYFRPYNTSNPSEHHEERKPGFFKRLFS